MGFFYALSLSEEQLASGEPLTIEIGEGFFNVTGIITDEPDAPFEVALGNPRLNAYNTVLWDEDRGLFRVWYELMAPLPLPDLYSYIGYAEVSADLQEVTKPLLHQLEVIGSTANNFLAGLSVNSSSSGASRSSTHSSCGTAAAPRHSGAGVAAASAAAVAPARSAQLQA